MFLLSFCFLLEYSVCMLFQGGMVVYTQISLVWLWLIHNQILRRFTNRWNYWFIRYLWALAQVALGWDREEVDVGSSVVVRKLFIRAIGSSTFNLIIVNELAWDWCYFDILKEQVKLSFPKATIRWPEMVKKHFIGILYIIDFSWLKKLEKSY